MENEVTTSFFQFKISLITIFILMFNLVSPINLFSEDSLIISKNDSNLSIVVNEKLDILYRIEPWRIGVTEILLGIEKPQSDDYLVHEYLQTLLLEQLSLFNFHMLNDNEKEYIWKQNSEDFDNRPYDEELFSRVYENSLAYLRNQKFEVSSDIVSNKDASVKSIIDSERIPVTIITEDKKNTIPYVSFNDRVSSLVTAKEYHLDSILSSEIEKIGNVYIFRMFLLAPLIADPVFLLEFSFTKNTLNTISKKILDALAVGIGGYTRSILEIKTDVSDVRVFIDNNLYSYTDIGLKVLPPGEYEIILYSKKNRYQDKKIYTLEPGKITIIEPVIPVPEETVFTLSIYPFNSIIIDEFQNKIKNPADLRISLDDKVTVYSEAGGYISENIVITKQFFMDSQYSVHLRPQWMDLDSEITYGQLKFYKSLASAILSLPASVVLYGLASEYEFPLYETALGVSLVINISLLLDTIISLVDYYQRTEVL